MVLVNMFRDNGIHTRDEQARRARPMVSVGALRHRFSVIHALLAHHDVADGVSLILEPSNLSVAALTAKYKAVSYS